MSDAASADPILVRLARRPALWLLVLCALVWLPGIFALPPLDRDESRFAQASKQMLETHDFVDIRFGSGSRYNKPVGIYWLQAAATEVLGDAGHDQIWTYRIPSFLGGYLALLLTFGIARSFMRREAAFAAAALLGVSIAMIAETQIATTDAALLAATLGAQLILFRVYCAARDPSRLPPGQWTLTAGWFAFACGVLLKGPVIAGVLGTSALAVSLWDREWRWLKAVQPLRGLAIVAIVVLPWAVAIAIHTQGAFYRQSLGHDFADKLVSGQESHGAPPGYYLALATLTLWPAVLFVLPGLHRAWGARTTAPIRYLMAWAASAWLMFELVPTKLPHYILPAYPPLILLAVFAAFELAPARMGVTARALKWIAALQFLIGLCALAVVVVLAPQRFGAGSPWLLMATAACCALIGFVAIVAFVRDRTFLAQRWACLAAALFVPLLTVGVAPRLSAFWISPHAAMLIAKDRRPGDPPPVVAGYAEPSLIFLLGTNTEIAVGADAAREAAQHGGLAMIEDRERSAFLTELGALDTQAFPVDALSGFDYSRGRAMHLTIYRVIAAESAAPAN